MARNLLAALSRKKRDCDSSESKLDRVLDLVDLTALGVGTTLGLGVYVLAGAVAKDIAGPAVAVSFLIAAIASAVAGLCYAEFASRVPKAGSAYVYSYVSVGEFIAYVIGWNLILEYVIGTASVARGFTNYLDALVDHKIRNELYEWFPINVTFLSAYPDFVSFTFVIILTVLLAIGVKESTTFNNAFTVLNLITIGIVLIGGSLKADPANWKIDKAKIPEGVNGGDGGFFPFGFAGIMKGAAKCFFGFVGFDSIATTGEEAKNPQRDIPLAIVISLFIIFFAYFGIATVLTLAWPYYDQDKEAPLPVLFEKLGWTELKWIVTIGAMCALCTSLLGAMFPLPRVLYAMGDDGLLFKMFARVHPKYKTPLLATVYSGIFSGIMAAIFNLEQLIDMMSIGTLLAYTIVAICVLILRYEPNAANKKYLANLEKTNNKNLDLFSFFKILFNLNNNKQATLYTAVLIKWATAAFCLLATIFCAFLVFAVRHLTPSEPLFFVPFIFSTICLIINFVILGRQPVDELKLSFKVPWVPFIPCLCITINTYLMLELDGYTWLRFIIWLAVGFLIYFTYGIKHSREGLMQKKESEMSQCEVETPKPNGISTNSATKSTSNL